jgi:hypothetical protein
VGQHPILQVQVADALEVVEVVCCTQIPTTRASGGLKRLRKVRQGSTIAEGVCTPKAQLSGISTKVYTDECGLADPTLQTPMPESEAGSTFGPPPPDSTPPPLRGNVIFWHL